VAAVMAQRLVRRLCSRCKEAHTPTATELESVGLPAGLVEGTTVYRAVGCDHCRRTGYSGRIGIFELLEMSPDLREAVFTNEATGRLREIAISSGGMRSLRADGHRKILDGTTSIDEIMRVLSKELAMIG